MRATHKTPMISGNHDLFRVRKAVIEDLDNIKFLADQHRDELGFILKPTLIKSITAQEVLVAYNLTDLNLVGFVHYHHRLDSQTTLYHIAVSQYRQQQGIGRELLSTLKNESEELGKAFISLKCPSGLPANRFYERSGFTLLSTEIGKKRPLNVWQLRMGNKHIC